MVVELEFEHVGSDTLLFKVNKGGGLDTVKQYRRDRLIVTPEVSALPSSVTDVGSTTSTSKCKTQTHVDNMTNG